MTNKILLTVIAILIVLVGIDLLTNYFDFPPIILSIAEFLAIIFMMINGTFMDRRYYKLTYLPGGGIILGMTMKIMHLPGAAEIITVSYMLIGGLYLFHFIFKKTKHITDILKAIVCISYCVLGILAAFHLFDEQLWILNSSLHYLFWFTFITFIGTASKEKSLFRTNE